MNVPSVLVIDDEPDNFDVIETFLNDRDYQLHYAASGQEAIDCLNLRSMLRIHRQYQQLVTFNSRLEATVQQRTAQLQTMIFQDALTTLPSRTFLLQKLAEVLQAGESSFAVVYLDCHRFKLVNGSFGLRYWQSIADRYHRTVTASSAPRRRVSAYG